MMINLSLGTEIGEESHLKLSEMEWMPLAEMSQTVLEMFKDRLGDHLARVVERS